MKVVTLPKRRLTLAMIYCTACLGLGETLFSECFACGGTGLNKRRLRISLSSLPQPIGRTIPFQQSAARATRKAS